MLKFPLGEVICMSISYEKRVACNNCGELLVVHMRPPGSSGSFPTPDQEIACAECGVTFCVGEGFPHPIIAVYKELPSTGFKPNNESPKVEPSVLAPFPPPAGDRVPEPPKGKWEDVPTPLEGRPMKGRSGKRTKGKGIAIKTSRSATLRLTKKPKKTGAKKRSYKR